jgi:hypothetical protein
MRATRRLQDQLFMHTSNYASTCPRSHRLCITSPCATPRGLRLQRLYLNLAVCRDYSPPGRSGSTSTTLCATTTSIAAALHQLRRAFRCLGTSRGSFCGLLSTTPPRAGSSSTTSPPPRVRVPRHVARLVAWLIAPLVVDYSASCRLVVDYFASAARPGASACRAARHAARRAARSRLLHLAQARRRLLRLRRASGCLSTSRGSSRGSSHRSSSTTPPRAGSSSTTSPPPLVRVPRHVALLVVDYSAYAARPSASARHAAHRRLLRAPRLRLAATLALLQPRRAS